MNKKTFDVIVLIGLAVFAILMSLVLHATFLVSAFLFLGLPIIYLLFRAKIKKKELFAAVTVFGIVYCFLLDYLAELNGAWAWAPSQLLFQQKILGVVTPDAIIWTALWVMLLVLFYEHLIEQDRKDTVSKKIWSLLAIGLFLIGAVLWLQYHDPSRIQVSYAYFVFGLCTVPPIVYIIYQRPRLVLKLLKAAAYFVPLYLAYELVGRSLGQWDFPGTYLAMIHVGTITFPIEEFLFWILLSSIITLGGYELFIDDFK